MAVTKSWIHKDKSGQLWFVGIYSNNFEDREKEILSWKSHLEYAQWVKETGVKLPITVAHQPKYPSKVHAAQFLALAAGLITAKEFSDNYLKLYEPYAIAQTELVVPVNGFTLVIGKILSGKESKVKLIDNLGWGMSHGFFALERDKDDDRVIEQYRSFEFSTLPKEMAANLMTLSGIKDNTMEEEMKGLSEEHRVALTELLNADPDKVEDVTAKAQELLLGMLDSKELDQEEAEPTHEDTYEEFRDKIFTELGVEQLNKSFEQFVAALKDVEKRLDKYEARLKDNERSEDERIAEQLVRPGAFFWNKSIETEVEPENADELKDKALGEKPVDGIDMTIKSNNPMQFAWNDLLGLKARQ